MLVGLAREGERVAQWRTVPARGLVVAPDPGRPILAVPMETPWLEVEGVQVADKVGRDMLVDLARPRVMLVLSTPIPPVRMVLLVVAAMVVAEAEVKRVARKDLMVMVLALVMAMVVPILTIIIVMEGNPTEQVPVVVVMAMVVVKMVGAVVEEELVEGTVIHRENLCVVIRALVSLHVYFSV